MRVPLSLHFSSRGMHAVRHYRLVALLHSTTTRDTRLHAVIFFADRATLRADIPITELLLRYLRSCRFPAMGSLLPPAASLHSGPSRHLAVFLSSQYHDLGVDSTLATILLSFIFILSISSWVRTFLGSIYWPLPPNLKQFRIIGTSLRVSFSIF